MSWRIVCMWVLWTISIMRISWTELKKRIWDTGKDFPQFDHHDAKGGHARGEKSEMGKEVRDTEDRGWGGGVGVQGPCSEDKQWKTRKGKRCDGYIMMSDEWWMIEGWTDGWINRWWKVRGQWVNDKDRKYKVGYECMAMESLLIKKVHDHEWIRISAH